jgi:hypothetical protein
VSTNYAGTYYLAEVGHLFKSLNFLGSYSKIGGFYIVSGVGHPSTRPKQVICLFLPLTAMISQECRSNRCEECSNVFCSCECHDTYLCDHE